MLKLAIDRFDSFVYKKFPWKSKIFIKNKRSKQRQLVTLSTDLVKQKVG